LFHNYLLIGGSSRALSDSDSEANSCVILIAKDLRVQIASSTANSFFITGSAEAIGWDNVPPPQVARPIFLR